MEFDLSLPWAVGPLPILTGVGGAVIWFKAASRKKKAAVGVRIGTFLCMTLVAAYIGYQFKSSSSNLLPSLVGWLVSIPAIHISYYFTMRKVVEASSKDWSTGRLAKQFLACCLILLLAWLFGWLEPPIAKPCRGRCWQAEIVFGQRSSGFGLIWFSSFLGALALTILPFTSAEILRRIFSRNQH